MRASASRIRFLVVVRADFRDLVVEEFERTVHRALPPQSAIQLTGLSVKEAEKALRYLAAHDAAQHHTRLAAGLCGTVIRGLAHDDEVCPAELRIVATALRDDLNATTLSADPMRRSRRV